MIQEPELEEGETCFYKDDANIDPDIALSYIGDKVQSILGHLQKDFEGGVSAENLGAKFGGYGSFLPMHQRSPSIQTQPKSPPRIQNPFFPRSPNLCPEGFVANPVVPSTQRQDSSSSNMHASQALKSSSDGASIREKAALSSSKVTEAFPGKAELPSSKSGNPLNHRPLKVRIKVGPEKVSQYNAQIYSLGLTSPSSSEGNSRDESDGLPLDSHETPYESPAYMLKIMTSPPVSNGLLLSPLCEDLLNLAREREYSVESDHEASPKNTKISVKLLNDDVALGKKTKIVDKSWNIEKSDDNHMEDLNDCDQKTLGDDDPECSMQPFCDLNCKSLPETVRDSYKNVPVKKRKGSKDRAQGASFEHISDQSYGKYEQPESRGSPMEKIEERARISQKDVSVDHRQDSRSRGKGSCLSLKAHSGHSEGEVVKKAMDDSILKVGLTSASSEHNGFDPHSVGRLSFEGGIKLKGQISGKKASKAEDSRNGDCIAPKKKLSGRKDVHGLHLRQKDVVHTSAERVKNPKRLLDRRSSDMPKDFGLDDVKAKSASADKLKVRSSNKKYFDKVSSDPRIMEPPPATVQSKEGMLSGLEHTVPAPILIQEDWVQCDRCEKWRLLPYGTKSEQLPEKWVCSMLDWLPGMNRCDISEDDTTAALHASYLIPVPENPNGAIAGGVSASAHGFGQNHRNFASDQMKQQKLKEKQNTINMGYALPSNGKNQVRLLAVNNGRLKDVKQSLTGVNASNVSDRKHSNKSATVSAKSSKRKGEHVIVDNANPKKKMKKESGEYVDRKGEMIKIKSKDVPTVDNYQISGGNLGMIGQSVKSGLPSKTAMKNGKKKSAARDSISGGVGSVQNYVKKHEDVMQDLPDNRPLEMDICNGIEATRTKIRLKEHAYSQNQVETGPDDVSSLQDRKVSVNEESKDGEFHRGKKLRVSQVEEQFGGSMVDDTSSKRKGEGARIWSSGSKEHHPRDTSIEKEQQVRLPRAKLRLTIEDIDKLRKDLGCEPLPTAATSSSSKVSDSRKNTLSYMERKGSPEESVSSSPMRMLYLNHASPMVDTEGKVDLRFDGVGAVNRKKFQDMNGRSELAARKGTSGLTIDNGSEILGSKNKLKKETAVDDNYHAPKHELSSNMSHPLSNESNMKSAKNNASVGKNNFRQLNNSRTEKKSTQREYDKTDLKASYPSSRDVMRQNLKQDLSRSSIEQAQMEPWSGKVRIGLRQGDKQGALHLSKHASGSLGSLKSSPLGLKLQDTSVPLDTSEAPKGAASTSLEEGTENYINNKADQSVALETSLRKKNMSAATASTVLKEAEDVLKEAEELRNHADLIKNSGFCSESNYEYFKASLKFLHGASLLELCNGEPSKHLDTRRMQMYGVAAQLCKTCANEYEKGHELAAAALAYKCMEVAYMRVVYCKSTTTGRVLQDLQSGLRMVPQGESPSSSASDVDNLNNLAMADKPTLPRGSGSHAVNHVILPRNRPNFVRLLDFTNDINSAMEAARKSRDAFAAAQVELKESQNREATVSVKLVIDFSFQDVEELIRLVWLAFNNINHQGLCGNRE